MAQTWQWNFQYFSYDLSCDFPNMFHYFAAFAVFPILRLGDWALEVWAGHRYSESLRSTKHLDAKDQDFPSIDYSGIRQEIPES
jgi:hypothetical protein